MVVSLAVDNDNSALDKRRICLDFFLNIVKNIFFCFLTVCIFKIKPIAFFAAIVKIFAD